MRQDDLTFDRGLYGDEFPLVAERAGPDLPPYQRCGVGERFWRASAEKSVAGNWRVYVRIFGPRGTCRGYCGFSAGHARWEAGELREQAAGLNQDMPVVSTPWSADVKGGVEFFTLSGDQARVLADRLDTLAGEADAREEADLLAWWSGCARTDGVANFADGEVLDPAPAREWTFSDIAQLDKTAAAPTGLPLPPGLAGLEEFMTRKQAGS
jgi:hypothetical protein